MVSLASLSAWDRAFPISLDIFFFCTRLPGLFLKHGAWRPTWIGMKRHPFLALRSTHARLRFGWYRSPQ